MGLATSGRPSLAICSVAAAATSQLPCKRGWLGGSGERALLSGLCDPSVVATAKVLDLYFAKLWDLGLIIICCLLALLLYVLVFWTLTPSSTC